MNKIEVYPPRLLIKTKMGNIEGMITGASIRFSGVNYEITHSSAGEIKTFWMFEDEFTTDIAQKQDIEFKK